MRIIIYHDDADGRCAAAIAGKDAAIGGGSPVYLAMEYGAELNETEFYGFKKGVDECWIVDFSLAPEQMRIVHEMVGDKLVWIDHHKTAIEKLPEFSELKGFRLVDRAACMLTWDYCSMLCPPPLAVRLIADRDVWAFEYGDAARYFHEAFWQEDSEPWRPVWGRWLSHACALQKELELGKLLYQGKKKRARNVLERLGRVEKLHGTDMTVLTANCMGTGDLGDMARELGHEVLHCYVEKMQDGRLVRVHSLYSASVDVGELAKIRGGGGHRGASGWVEVMR